MFALVTHLFVRTAHSVKKCHITALYSFQIPFHLEQNKWWEVAMHVGPSVRKYDPLNGGTIWFDLNTCSYIIIFFRGSKIMT